MIAGYDHWLYGESTQDEEIRECLYCGNPTDKAYCSKECANADVE